MTIQNTGQDDKIAPLMEAKKPTADHERQVTARETGPDAADFPEISAEDRLIKASVHFINERVAHTLLEGSIQIGEYLLINFFGNNPEAVTSPSAFKTRSYCLLCNHEDLSLSRRTLSNMVRVTVQERFLKSNDVDTRGLNYTHRVYLTVLPNTADKISLVAECITENFSTRRLADRIREIRTKPGTGSVLPGRWVRQYINTIDNFPEKLAVPEIFKDENTLLRLKPETRSLLRGKAGRLQEQLRAVRADCRALITRLEALETKSGE